MKKETFIKLVNNYKKIETKSEEFSKGLESILNISFKNWYEGENRVMFLWPIEGAATMLKDVLIDLGDSEEGAGWFIYEGIDQIDKGGTEIEANSMKYSIKSYGDYYDYLEGK